MESKGTSREEDIESANPLAANVESKESSNGGLKAKQSKKAEVLGKTKMAASNSMKKVKQGASVGMHWIKDKYQKTTQKH